MWTQITCLANDEQSIPQRWQRVAVPLPPQCYEKRDSQVRKYLQFGGLASFLKGESGIVARS
jgi:hypothetical protein